MPYIEWLAGGTGHFTALSWQRGSNCSARLCRPFRRALISVRNRWRNQHTFKSTANQIDPVYLLNVHSWSHRAPIHQRVVLERKTFAVIILYHNVILCSVSETTLFTRSYFSNQPVQQPNSIPVCNAHFWQRNQFLTDKIKSRPTFILAEFPVSLRKMSDTEEIWLANTFLVIL